MIMPLASFLARHRRHVLLENESFTGEERLLDVPSKVTTRTTRRRRVLGATNKFLSRTKLKSAIFAKNILILGRIKSAWNHRRQQNSKSVEELSITQSSLSSKLLMGKNEETLLIAEKDDSGSSTSASSKSSTPLECILVVDPAIETRQDSIDEKSQQAQSEVESLGDCTGLNSDDMDGFDAEQYIAEPPIFFEDFDTQTLEGGSVISRVVSALDATKKNARPNAMADSSRGNVCVASRGAEKTNKVSTRTTNRNKQSADSKHCSPFQTFAASDYFLGFQCSFQGTQRRAPLFGNDATLSSTAWYQGMVEVVLGKQKTCSHCLEMLCEKEAIVRVYPYADTDLQKHFFHASCNEERRILVIEKDQMLKEFEEFCSLLRAHKKQKHVAKQVGREQSSEGHLELAGMKHFASKFSFIRIGRRK